MLVFGVHPHTPAGPPPPHVTPVPVHGVPNPQSGIEREPPQLSVVLYWPQFLLASLHSWASVFGVHPHTPVVPPPPQVTPVPLHGVPKPQSAMLRVPPQLSVVLNRPQFLPASLHNTRSVFGVQPHTLGTPAPAQVCGGVHVPHETVPPQPSGATPQFLPPVQVVAGVQPHLLAVPPPPHVCGAMHVPHEVTPRGRLQLSVPAVLPHSAFWLAQKATSLSLMQPQTLVDSTPHSCGKTHVPQELTVRIAPQLSMRLTVPQFRPYRLQKAESLSGSQPHTFPLPHVCPPGHVPH